MYCKKPKESPVNYYSLDTHKCEKSFSDSESSSDSCVLFSCVWLEAWNRKRKDFSNKQKVMFKTKFVHIL